MTDATAFGAMIRAARTSFGLSLVDAALTLDMSKQTLADLETAKASVGLATALKVARELGVTVFAVPSTERELVRREILRVRREENAHRQVGTIDAPAQVREGVTRPKQKS